MPEMQSRPTRLDQELDKAKAAPGKDAAAKFSCEGVRKASHDARLLERLEGTVLGDGLQGAGG